MTRSTAVTTVARRRLNLIADQSTITPPSIARRPRPGEAERLQYPNAFGRRQVADELVRSGFLLLCREDDRRPFERRIKGLRDLEESASVLHRRRERERQGHNPGVGIAGLSELRGLGNILAADQLVLDLLVQMLVPQRGDSRAAV